MKGASIFLKVRKPKLDKVATKQNKQNNKRQFFLPKINKVYISEPNFTKSEGKVRVGQVKIISLQEFGQKRKMVIKIEFTPLSHSPDCKMFPFKKGFKR